MKVAIMGTILMLTSLSLPAALAGPLLPSAEATPTRAIAPVNWNKAQLIHTIDLTQLYPNTVCPVYAINTTLSPDDRTLAVSSDSFERSCGSSGPNITLTLWDMLSAQRTATLLQGNVDEFWGDSPIQQQEPPELTNLYLKGDMVYEPTFTPDGAVVAAGLSNSTIKLWNAKTGSVLHTLKGHAYAVHGIAIRPDGQVLASASSDKTIKLWNIKTGQLIRTLGPAREAAIKLDFSPDGQRLLSTTQDSNIHLWNVQSGERIRTIPIHRQGATVWLPARLNPSRIRLGAADSILATADMDHSIKLWNARTGARIVTMKGHQDSIQSLTFSPDGKMLASSSQDGTLKLWSLTSLQQARSFQLVADRRDTWQRRLGYDLDFSPDGQTIAVTNLVETASHPPEPVNLLNTNTGQIVFEVPGSSGATSFQFTADGQGFVTTSGATVQIWRR
ncbi:MAG: WD40 repeat domain-containing protein [Aphanothece sp. CMT-3BRIN-NPC111]|jgi:hypothetical protein|nr:WD40 repeat domain-containing protein [Aphanothece sp. CMT-3BRIN-NPC111]